MREIFQKRDNKSGLRLRNFLRRRTDTVKTNFNILMSPLLCTATFNVAIKKVAKLLLGRASSWYFSLNFNATGDTTAPP